MKDYELTLVIDPDLTPEDQKKLMEKIKKTIKDVKGKVEETQEWGRKELTYPIKKKNAGFYFLWKIKLDSDLFTQFDKKLKAEEGIIRFLLVKED